MGEIQKTIQLLIGQPPVGYEILEYVLAGVIMIMFLKVFIMFFSMAFPGRR